jgi:hypothetical protein
MRPWPEVTAALATAPAEGWRGQLHRCLELGTLVARLRTSPDFRFLYAATTESRFTYDGGPQRLYVSAEKFTAEAELMHYFEGIGLPNTANLVVTCALSSVLDLTDPSNLVQLGTSLDELDLEWQEPDRHPGSVTQQLGTAVFDCGRFNAIRFMSARARAHYGKNLVIFPDQLQAGVDHVTFTLRNAAGDIIIEETL